MSQDLFQRWMKRLSAVTVIGGAVLVATANERPANEPTPDSTSGGTDPYVNARPLGKAAVAAPAYFDLTNPGLGAIKHGPRGRYQTLLRKIEVPADNASYGDFHDYGYWSGTAYAGHTDLPPGYWVFMAPHWLIYRDSPNDGQVAVDLPAIKHSFSPLQMTGKPDSPQGGDVGTAWAPATADGQREWIELSYDADVEAIGVLVYEAIGTGAVDSVTAYLGGGEQAQVWAGKDPVEPGKNVGVAVITFKTPVTTKRIRIGIDSPAVAGWNEIDAVGLLDKDGKIHWATGATASSTYGVTQVRHDK